MPCIYSDTICFFSWQHMLLDYPVRRAKASGQRRRIKTDEKAKVVGCFGGTYLILICRTNHLAARMIWRKKVVGKTTILVGWLFGMVGTGWSSLFQSIHSAKYHSLAFILLILFYKIILVENIWCGREFNQFCRPNSSDDVCLLFCCYPSYLYAWDPSYWTKTQQHLLIPWQ